MCPFGSEIFYSYEFALEVLKKCKEEFIDTAIRNVWAVQWNIRMLPYVDHVLIDIKHMDPLDICIGLELAMN